MPDTPRPAHNHPLDSLCLVIACPRGAYDAGKAAHLDALTAAVPYIESAVSAWNGYNGDDLMPAVVKAAAILRGES